MEEEENGADYKIRERRKSISNASRSKIESHIVVRELSNLFVHSGSTTTESTACWPCNQPVVSAGIRPLAFQLACVHFSVSTAGERKQPNNFALRTDLRTDLCNPLRSLPLRLLMVRREMRSRPQKSGAKMQNEEKNLPRGEKRQNALGQRLSPPAGRLRRSWCRHT